MSVFSLIIKHENRMKKINDCIGMWRNITYKDYVAELLRQAATNCIYVTHIM